MKNKKTIITIIQIVVTVTILIVVFHDAKKRAQMAEAIRNANKTWLIGGFISYGIVELFAMLRWDILLRVQGIALSRLRLGTLMMIGIFFNQFLPGGTGGDVVKSFYLLKETPDKKTAALLAVLIDRVIGLLGLMLLTGIIFYFQYDWLMRTPATAALAKSLLLLLGGSFAAIAFSFIITRLGLVHKLPPRMPFRDKFVELSAAYNLYSSAWPASLLALAYSVIVHIGSFGVFYFAGKAFLDTTRILDFLTIMPIINTITSLPVSVGGLGVRESLFQTLLWDLRQVPAGIAVMISTSGYLLIALWGGLGGIMYLFYRPSEHAKLSVITHEVEELEEKIAHSE